MPYNSLGGRSLEAWDEKVTSVLSVTPVNCPDLTLFANGGSLVQTSILEADLFIVKYATT